MVTRVPRGLHGYMCPSLEADLDRLLSVLQFGGNLERRLVILVCRAIRVMCYLS